MDVTARRVGVTGDFAVEISPDGTIYSLVPSVPLSTSSSTEVTYRATIPANTIAGSSYRVRLVSNNSTVVSTPSSTLLKIKARPDPPIAPAELIECEKPIGSRNPFMSVSLTATSPMAETKLYNQDGSIPYNDSSTKNYFIIVKSGPGTTFYYATQQIDGCESDKREIKVVVKPKAPLVIPINIYSTGGDIWGAINYNQGDKAVSIREYGLRPLPDNVIVYYLRESGDLPFTGLTDAIDAYSSSGTSYPVIPKTDKPGKAILTFRTSLDGCAGSIYNQNHLVVTVNPALGIEDQVLADAIDVYPIPATTNLTVHIPGLAPTQTAFLEVADLKGHITTRQETRQPTSSVSLDQYPAGTYILNIRVGDKKASKRIVKL
ncbi:hypothetical protein GCM10028808_44720 [Spirosoma migulaei]